MSNSPRYSPLVLFPDRTVLLPPVACLLYTSDAADDLIGVDLGGRRIIKKKSEMTTESLLRLLYGSMM